MKSFKNIQARWLTCLFFLFFFAPVNSKIIQDEVLIVDEKFFSYKEVCEKLTKRKSPLISYHSISKLDCMGTIVSVGEFCDLKTKTDPYYIRGLVEKENKKVICKSAKRVRIKYLCEGKKDKLCQDKEIGCYLLQEKLAKRLKISHSSLLTDKEGRVLNCHFMPKMTKKDGPKLPLD